MYILALCPETFLFHHCLAFLFFSFSQAGLSTLETDSGPDHLWTTCVCPVAKDHQEQSWIY